MEELHNYLSEQLYSEDFTTIFSILNTSKRKRLDAKRFIRTRINNLFFLQTKEKIEALRGNKGCSYPQLRDSLLRLSE